MKHIIQEVVGYLVVTNNDFIKIGDWVIYPIKTTTPVQFLGGDLIGGEKKVVMHLPLNNSSPILKGVLLLPECDDIYKLAENILKSHSDYNTEGFSEYQNGRLNGIIEGLKYNNQVIYPKFFISKTKYCRCKYGSIMTYLHPCKKECQNIDSLGYETTTDAKGNILVTGIYN